MTAKNAFFFLGVVVAFLAIFVPLALRIRSGEDGKMDAGRLRRTYVALALYEGMHDGYPAPNLGLIRLDVDPSDLQSVADQNLTGKDFPLDPARPEMPLRSPVRVSWSYRWHWKEAGDPMAVRMDPRRGLLAGWWTGPVLRVNVSGALVEKAHQGLTFKELFGE